MTLDPECAACGRDHDLHVFLHLDSNSDICLCVSCAANEMARAGRAYQYKGRHLAIIEKVTNDYLNLHPNAMEASRSMQEPYDQMMVEYITAEDRRKNVLIHTELESLYAMPSDAVLDEYNERRYELARICGNISPVVSYGNIPTSRDEAYAMWKTLRADAIGG